MATRKTKIEAPKPVRNEPALADISNTFPKSERFQPRQWGKAGVRVVVEQALQGLHGFGTELWTALGIDKRELATRKAEIVEMMKKVVADPERGFATNRTAAVAILGELGGVAAMPDLAAVLTSPYERPTTRAWAASALGHCGRARAVPILRAALSDPHPLVRRRVIDGLAETRAKEALPLLVEVSRGERDPVLANRAIDSVRALEKTLKLKPAVLRRRVVPRAGGTTSVPD